MSNNNNSNNNRRSRLLSAIKLYEENGDPISSLRDCQLLWKDPPPHYDDCNNDTKSEAAEGIISRHNRAVLEQLSLQRQRVRPRPCSFDDDSDKTGAVDNHFLCDNSGDGGDNLINLLKSIANALSIPLKGNNCDNIVLCPTQTMQAFIASYNLSLSLYARGNYRMAMQHVIMLGGHLFDLMDGIAIIGRGCNNYYNKDDAEGNYHDDDGMEKKNENASGGVNHDAMMVQFKDVIFPLHSKYVASIFSIMSRALFLLLDCIFTIHGGDAFSGGRGSNDDDDGQQSIDEVGMLLLSLDNHQDKVNNKEEEEEGAEQKKRRWRSVNDILDWIEDTILVYAKHRQEEEEEEDGKKKKTLVGLNNDCNNGGGGEKYDVLKADEIKFKLHLYRSRVLLQSMTTSTKKATGEMRAKLARKELKNAMDIYQNKLCIVEEGGGGVGSNEEGEGKPTGGCDYDNNNDGKGKRSSETTSISGSLVTSASDALWNEGKGGVVAGATFEGMPNNKQRQQQKQHKTAPPTSSSPNTPPVIKVKKDDPGLHVRHESTLYMKANLEYLRGNTTKSLKLCAEARTAGKKSRMKGNNMKSEEVDGFAHHVDDATASNSGMKITNAGEDDGVESQMANDYDEAIYYNNLAMVHQSAGKIHVALHYYSYAISYMGNVQLRPNDNCFWSDGVPRPNFTADVLNNASLCAFQAHDYKGAYEYMTRCVTLSPLIFGERARCWLRLAQSLIGIHANQHQTANSNKSVGWSNDISLLECSMGSEEDLRNISTNPFPRILSCLEKAQHLSNGLETGDDVYVDTDCFEASTLSLAYAKLEMKDAAGALEMCKLVLGSDDFATTAEEDRSNYTSESLRRRAMARLYACEAFCRMGDPTSALVVVESESFLQCIASDVSASNSTQHDAYAQFVTRAAASGALSSAGMFERSKLHASMTTGAAKTLTADKTKGNVDNVFEKRILLFSCLNEDDTDGAIAILQSGLSRV